MAFSRRAFLRSAGAGCVGMLPGVNGITAVTAVAPEMPPIMFDKDGLIVHRGDGPAHRDGGDTAQREGWYWFGIWLRQQMNDPWLPKRALSFPEVLALLEPKRDGVFYRHPKLAPWNDPYSKDYGFSWDQFVSLVAAMGVWQRTEELRRLWNALPQDGIGGTKHTFNGSWESLLWFKHAYFTGDIVRPMSINLYRRALNEDPMRAGDGNGLGGDEDLRLNALSRVPPLLGDRDNTGDDLNLIVMLLMSALRYPSLNSATAMNLYAKNRLVSYGSFIESFRDESGIDIEGMGKLPDGVQRTLDAKIAAGMVTSESRVFGAVRWYHRSGSGGNPMLAELYRPIIKRFLE